ncbi:MAG: hypothetical protein IID34_13790 [Planctomycetes bacterium]|nr:hypothetical protein [Planctomycetota bacterium]
MQVQDTEKVVITQETFRGFEFRDPAPGRWVVTWHPNLTHFREYERTIVLGICEVLVGHGLKGQLKDSKTVEVMYPEDFDQYGLSSCVFDFEAKTIYVRNMMRGDNPINFFAAT